MYANDSVLFCKTKSLKKKRDMYASVHDTSRSGKLVQGGLVNYFQALIHMSDLQVTLGTYLRLPVTGDRYCVHVYTYIQVVNVVICLLSWPRLRPPPVNEPLRTQYICSNVKKQRSSIRLYKYTCTFSLLIFFHIYFFFNSRIFFSYSL